VGAIILVGGPFYLWMVMAPRAADAEGDPAERMFAGRRSKWAMWVGIATLVVLVTGFYNYLNIIWMHEKLNGKYHMLAGIKIILGLVVFFLAAIIAGRSEAAARFRQRIRFWLGVCVITGLAVVLLGSVLRTFPRELKPTEIAAPMNVDN
jgi:uncharacterized membrane protein